MAGSLRAARGRARRSCAGPRPRSAAARQLGPGEGHHVERGVARPLEEVLHEVEQRCVRPLHVLEGEHRRIDVGQALEEQPPGREQILPLAAACSPSPSRWARRGSTKRRSPVGDVVLHAAAASPGRVVGLVLGDAAAHPHHVCERPVRDALAVGGAAAAVPVDRPGPCRRSTCRTPTPARLADPGDPRHRDQVRPVRLRRCGRDP